MAQPPTFAPNSMGKILISFRDLPNPQPISLKEYGGDGRQIREGRRCNSESLLPKKVGVGSKGWEQPWL